MGKKSKGYRSKTRALLRKKPREKGKISLSKLLQDYHPGDRVCIRIDSGVHKGMPHRGFQGKIGTIAEKRGRAYIVEIPMGGKKRSVVIARPEHLQSYEGEEHA